MSSPHRQPTRIFKTAWFSKAAKKARIDDAELRVAVQEAARGQAVSLGAGVFKKRLNDNRYRAIILAKGGQYWICEYLFAKKDRDNISNDELAAFRQLAKSYEALTERQLDRLIRDRAFTEIGNDCDT